MNLDFTEEEKMLKTMVREFLARECPKSVVRQLEESELGYSPELWKKMADLGWQGMAVPSSFGGSNMTFFDLALLFEEMGRNILPGPFLSTVICALGILKDGSEEQKARYLPGICDGSTIFALALNEPSGGWGPEHVSVRAVPRGGEYLISGTKLFVPDANIARYLLVAARTEADTDPRNGVTVFIVDKNDPKISCDCQLSMGLDNKCELNFKEAAVNKTDILGAVNKGWDVVADMLRKATALKVIEMSGGMQAALDMANEYVKQRVQYGRPIGSFQAIQHYLADMWGNVERTRSIAWEVNWKVSANCATDLDISIAKAWANDACRWVMEKAVQCHGAIGTTRDHDMGLYFRRGIVAGLDYGGSDYHRAVIARELGF